MGPELSAIPLSHEWFIRKRWFSHAFYSRGQAFGVSNPIKNHKSLSCWIGHGYRVINFERENGAIMSRRRKREGKRYLYDLIHAQTGFLPSIFFFLFIYCVIEMIILLIGNIKMGKECSIRLDLRLRVRSYTRTCISVGNTKENFLFWKQPKNRRCRSTK